MRKPFSLMNVTLLRSESNLKLVLALVKSANKYTHKCNLEMPSIGEIRNREVTEVLYTK